MDIEKGYMSIKISIHESHTTLDINFYDVLEWYKISIHESHTTLDSK